MKIGPLGSLFKMPSLTEQLRAHEIREDVVLAAGRTAFGRQSDRALFTLPALLSEDEAVSRLLEGRLDSALGIWVLTTRRLVFAPKDTARVTSTAIMLSDVTGVSWRRSRGLGLVEVTTARETVVVDQILGKQAEWICDEIREAVATPSEQRVILRDPLEELAELRALHRAGAIADEEFDVRKRQLFGRI